MTVQAIPITTLLSVDPTVTRRAQRVQFAVDLLEHRTTERDARRRVQKRFQCSRATAWRIVSVAKDLVA
jgi:hypothetical protein